MDFKSCVEVFFRETGAEVTVKVNDTEYLIKAVIQPMRYKNKMYLEPERTELGFKDSECFLYLGPAVPDFAGLEPDTTVIHGDRVYKTSRADRISIGGETVYIWAVLSPKIKEGVYDYVQ